MKIFKAQEAMEVSEMTQIDVKNKLYRHEVLIYAIDFFTQNFESSQIIKYAFEFLNEMLTLHSSALFLKENDRFIMKSEQNYDIKQYSFRGIDKLNHIALFHGDIVKSSFEEYLTQEEIQAFKPKLIIPLIIRDKMIGFIISNGKAIGEFNTDDYIIASVLMRLVNKSLENASILKELEDKNKELDLQIFNLFFINQTTRTLLSELDIEALYTLSTDIIGEVTCSKITTFGLYDEIRDKIIIKSYRDIFTFQSQYVEFELNKRVYERNNVILHFQKDRDTIKAIFKNWEDFEKLDTEYIVLIVKEKILGFVTISTPVNDREYNKLLFELIESLSSTIYISLTNARLFKTINEQKKSMEKKYNVLNKLNKLLKGINNSSDVMELSTRVMKTLNIGFNIEKAFVALKDNNKLCIFKSIGCDIEDLALERTLAWEEIHNNEVTYEYTAETSSKYLQEDILEKIGDSNCLIISPIRINEFSFDGESNILGYIVVLKTRKSLGLDEVLLIDTISNSVAPIIKQMNLVSEIKEEYKPDKEKILLRKIYQMIENKKRYSIDFKIYYKRIIKKPFERIDFTPFSEYEYIYIDNYIFVLSEEELKIDIFDASLRVDSIEDFYKWAYKIDVE